MGNLMQSFHLRFALVCSITHYGKCPCVGELPPITLNFISSRIPEPYKSKFNLVDIYQNTDDPALVILIIKRRLGNGYNYT